ncbi:hypothetical protein PGT21_010853 [Puccinia graminis f. sp. tritici]|uniref:Uncharacterized protein n=1 Tax=Puccinia graminis f. sp. tritici TaxID=56615 RepID=A0A5B0MU77_PUCGR|nr:hypothetical protein PGT21_010853 [Puccinia graminis f. sp. tritici]
MDPLEIMEWVEDDDDILASLQTTISLFFRASSPSSRPSEGAGSVAEALGVAFGSVGFESG